MLEGFLELVIAHLAQQSSCSHLVDDLEGLVLRDGNQIEGATGCEKGLGTKGHQQASSQLKRRESNSPLPPRALGS